VTRRLNELIGAGRAYFTSLPPYLLSRNMRGCLSNLLEAVDEIEGTLVEIDQSMIELHRRVTQLEPPHEGD